MTTPGFLGADPDHLDAMSRQILGHAQQIDDLRASLTAQLFQAGWSGEDAESHQLTWEKEHAPALGMAVEMLRDMGQKLGVNAAQQRAASTSDTLYSPPIVLAGNESSTGDSGDGDRRDRRDPAERDPDGRDGRRMRSDEIFRREDGGDRGNSHFSNDWAGRAILDRYLGGGDDWTINDDKAWSDYMMGNQTLREQLTEPTQIQAQQALTDYLRGKGPNGTFDQTFHAEMENGEGIVGYQYLHGTSSDAGDFKFNGTTTVTPRPDGTFEVVLNSGYTWNDTIDPNPQYSTDQWKSKLAEIFTLGSADPYDIHITWHAQSKVILDANGNVIGIEGYPAP